MIYEYVSQEAQTTTHGIGDVVCPQGSPSTSPVYRNPVIILGICVVFLHTNNPVRPKHTMYCVEEEERAGRGMVLRYSRLC